jgi:hypothetical protein
MGCAAVQEHRQHKGLNNRAENSHQPTRNRVSAEAPEPRNAVSRSNFFGLAIPPGAPILVRSSNSRSGGHDDPGSSTGNKRGGWCSRVGAA